MGQGKQNNESAVEQAKDEQISVYIPFLTISHHSVLNNLQDYIRGQYKSSTGSDAPIEDKKTTFG